MNYFGVSFFLSISMILSTIRSDTKVWKFSLKFNDVNNWRDKQLPQDSDIIVFPEKLDSVLTLSSKQLTSGQLVFPDDGDILLPVNGKIEFDESKIGNVRFFKNIKTEDWVDPSAWSSLGTKFPEVVPHLERIPCQVDDVVFPDNDISVYLPKISVKVKSFTLEKNAMTNAMLGTYMLTQTGNRQFVSEDYQDREQIVSINNETCVDHPEGCICHPLENIGFLEREVCGFVKCPKTFCLLPVKPEGHCCHICGSILTLKSQEFNMEKLKSKIGKFMSLNYPDVPFYISRIINKQSTSHLGSLIQVILADSDNQHAKIAVEIYDYINEEFKMKFYYLKSAGLSYDPEGGLGGFKLVLGTFLIVAITMTIIYFVFYPEKTCNRWSLNVPRFTLPAFGDFVFARFENVTEAEGNLEFGSRSVASSLYNMDRAFDNPMYEEPGISGHISMPLKGVDENEENTRIEELVPTVEDNTSSSDLKENEALIVVDSDPDTDTNVPVDSEIVEGDSEIEKS